MHAQDAFVKALAAVAMLGAAVLFGYAGVVTSSGVGVLFGIVAGVTAGHYVLGCYDSYRLMQRV